MRNLPTSDDDKYHHAYPNKVRYHHSRFISRSITLSLLQISSASAALDLAHVSQTSPRNQKSSEWQQYQGNPRGPDGSIPRSDRRTVTNPNVTLSAPSDDLANTILGGPSSASAVPLVSQQSQGSVHSHQAPTSRRGSPHSLLDSLSATTRSVPATPLGMPSTTSHLLKTPGTPHTPDLQALNGRIATPNHLTDAAIGNEIQASLSRLSGSYDNSALTFNSIQSTGRDDVCSLFFYITLKSDHL